MPRSASKSNSESGSAEKSGTGSDPDEDKPDKSEADTSDKQSEAGSGKDSDANEAPEKGGSPRAGSPRSSKGVKKKASEGKKGDIETGEATEEAEDDKAADDKAADDDDEKAEKHAYGEEENWDEEDWDEDYDEEEESEYETDDEEEEADDDDDYVEEDKGEGDSESDRLTIVTVSNETERSDLEILEAVRQTAQVVPEPPWAKSLKSVWQCLFAFFLPVLLVFIIIYAFFKCTQALFQILNDIWIILRQLIWLLIRVALSPLYIMWKVFVPRFIQKQAEEEFERRVGRRLRAVWQLLTLIQDTIFDIPSILVACVKAAGETCMMPAKRVFGVCCWRYGGFYFDKMVSKPMYDAHVNRHIQKKRKQAGHDKKELEDKKKSSLLSHEGKSRKRKEMIKQRHRKQILKKQLAQDDIKLFMPVANKHHKEQRVQLIEKERKDYFSRTMITERRYAIAVGFTWCMIGLTLLLLVIDGAEGETCVICEDNSDLEVRICRNGKGRDCAFQEHQDQVLVAIGLCGVGVMLLAYSVFLYKPVHLAQKKFEDDLKKKEEEAEAAKDAGPDVKGKEDPDMLAVRMIRELQERRSIARMMKSVYVASPLWTIVRMGTHCISGPFHTVLRWENRRRLHERSIALQYALYMAAGGWVLWVKNAFMRYQKRTNKRVFGDQGETDLETTRMQRCCVSSAALFLGSCCCCLFSMACGRKCVKRFGRSQLARVLRKALGIVDLEAEECGSPTGSARKSMVNTGARNGKAGGINLEDTLAMFGLNELDAEELAAERKRKAEDEERIAAAERKAAMEELTSGLAESQREAGQMKRLDIQLEPELDEIGPAEIFVEAKKDEDDESLIEG